MPIYQYKCKTCDHEFEKLQKFSDSDPVCEKCNSQVSKIIGSTNFQLKGNWYKTTKSY